MRKSGTKKDDVIRGGAGDDFLSGGGGDDVLIGKAGDDVLIGGNGVDALKGGKGADIYVLKSMGDLDTIIGFKPGVDRIYIDVPGAPDFDAADVFGSTLLYAGKTITYEGEAIGAVKGGLTLTANDFLII